MKPVFGLWIVLLIGLSVSCGQAVIATPSPTATQATAENTPAQSQPTRTVAAVSSPTVTTLLPPATVSPLPTTTTPSPLPTTTADPSPTPAETATPEPPPGATRTLALSAGVDVVQVFVPAGSFVMGDEAVIGDNHKPPHDVALDAFWLDRTEVTNQMYAACVAAGVCAPPEPDLSGDPLLAEYPVVNVTWGDADAFCRWAGGRLPTEAEWEYAVRGPEGHTYPWGEAPIPCADPAYDAGCNSLAAVESQPAAAGWVGALGMVGNAMEWVNDWYDAEYYARSPLANPPGPDSGRQRVVRGTTGYEPVYAAAAVRSVMAPDERYEVLGFRCARTEIATDTAAVTSTTIAAATATPAATTTSSLQAGEGRIVMRGGVEVEQVYVPAGSFAMGSEDGLPQERPVHEVILDGFWIDRTEVTNA